jgi:alkanesulfonate monooxygenase SsuD/methylene tetrahydromethanopterin reductase-like flavin-dependent oxidoreductase (luciferase family)
MESWDIIEMGLREGRIRYEGKHFQIPESPLAIRPLQQPLPEIYVTGLEPTVVQRTAKAGHVPFITAGWRGMPLLRDMHAHLQRQYTLAGVPTESMPLGVQQYVFVTDSKAEALDIAERARFIARVVTQTRAGDPVLDGHFIQAPPLPDEPSLETFRDNLVIGDPHLVAEKLASEIRELGTTHLSCFTQIGMVEGRRASRSLERFAAEVVPLLERDFGMPLEAVHADRTAAARRDLAAVA